MNTFSSPWADLYFTNGHKSVRIYARGWKWGEDASKEGLWRACIQQIESGLVMAEKVEDYTWVVNKDLLKWAKSQLDSSYTPCNKKEACKTFNKKLRR